MATELSDIERLINVGGEYLRDWRSGSEGHDTAEIEDFEGALRRVMGAFGIVEPPSFFDEDADDEAVPA